MREIGQPGPCCDPRDPELSCPKLFVPIHLPITTSGRPPLPPFEFFGKLLTLVPPGQSAAMDCAANARPPGHCNMRGSCGKKSVFSPNLPCPVWGAPAEDVSSHVQFTCLLNTSITPKSDRTMRLLARERRHASVSRERLWRRVCRRSSLLHRRSSRESCCQLAAS